MSLKVTVTTTFYNITPHFYNVKWNTTKRSFLIISFLFFLINQIYFHATLCESKEDCNKCKSKYDKYPIYFIEISRLSLEFSIIHNLSLKFFD